MRTRVTFLKTTYNCDITNRVVVCTIVCEISDPEYKFSDGITNSKHLSNKNMYRFIVKGKARAHINDPWNETIGKRLAESRARLKAYEKAAKIWDDIRTYYGNLDNIAFKYYLSCKSCAQEQFEHIYNLIQK